MIPRAFPAACVLLLSTICGCVQREDSCNAYLETYSDSLNRRQTTAVADLDRQNIAFASALERMEPRDPPLHRLYEKKLALFEENADIMRKYERWVGADGVTPEGFAALKRRDKEIEAWIVQMDDNLKEIDAYCRP